MRRNFSLFRHFQSKERLQFVFLICQWCSSSPRKVNISQIFDVTFWGLNIECNRFITALCKRWKKSEKTRHCQIHFRKCIILPEIKANKKTCTHTHTLHDSNDLHVPTLSHSYKHNLDRRVYNDELVDTTSMLYSLFRYWHNFFANGCRCLDAPFRNGPFCCFLHAGEYCFNVEVE